MGRTSPVVRAGLVALARHGGVMVTAVTATAAVLLAGCGAHTAELDTAVVPAPGGGALVRAQAEVICPSHHCGATPA